MIEEKLQIGKVYIREERIIKDRPASVDLIKIVGRVDEDTVEYINGYRFFSNRGMFYDVHGRSRLWRKPAGQRFDNEPSWNDKYRVKNSDLTRLATREDFSRGFDERYRVDISSCTDASVYIPADSPQFLISIGCLYVSRMGFFHFIDRIYHSQLNDEILFRSERGYFNERGKISSASEPSMTDIAFQRIYK